MRSSPGSIDWRASACSTRVGLSYAEFVLAMAVNEMERPTQAEVGELLDMSKSLVSQRVSGLLAKGFLVQRRERRESPAGAARSDRRPGGRRWRRSTSSSPATRRRLFEVLGPSRPQFLQSLRRLRDAIAAVEASQEDGKPSTLR